MGMNVTLIFIILCIQNASVEALLILDVCASIFKYIYFTEVEDAAV